MIVRIIKTPDIPILSEWPTRAGELIKGLIVQAPKHRLGASRGDLTSKRITNVEPGGVKIDMGNIIDAIFDIDVNAAMDLQEFAKKDGFLNLYLFLSWGEVDSVFFLWEELPIVKNILALMKKNENKTRGI